MRTALPQILRPFETTTAEGRSRERYRRISLTAATSLAAKAVTVGTVFVTARFALSYLGDERYGLWMTITSVISMLAFADLGMGNGLLNAISHARGRDDDGEIRRAVSSAFFMLSGLAALLVLVFAATYPLVPWAAVFNVRTAAAAAEAGPAMAVFFGCFAMTVVLSLVTRVQMGFQEGFQANLWLIGGSLLGLAGVVLAMHLRASLPWLVLAVSGAPVVMLGLAALLQFGWIRPHLRPSWTHVSGPAARTLLGRGLMFAGFAVLGPIAFYSDNLVAAHVVSAEAVADYAVNAKLFGLCTILLSLFSSALWPAWGEAYARNDTDWVRTALRRSLLWGAAMSVLPALALVALGPSLLELWLGRPMFSPLSLRLGMAAWVTVSGIGFTLGSFLSSVNMLKFNLALSVVMTAAALALKIGLGIAWGLPGIVWGVTVAYAVTLLPCATFIPRLLALMKAGNPPREDVLWLP